MKQEVEVIMIFKVNEYDKTYMAYTLDDIMNKDFNEIDVHFMNVINYESENPKLIPILDNEKEKVLEVYNELIKQKENKNV
ncbi:MAG: DUF1292 domain-containing protein [Bacilli bacterium]|nr:DUF1292 domain-containing protein [Bacilli bacterium]